MISRYIIKQLPKFRNSGDIKEREARDWIEEEIKVDSICGKMKFRYEPVSLLQLLLLKDLNKRGEKREAWNIIKKTLWPFHNYNVSRETEE